GSPQNALGPRSPKQSRKLRREVLGHQATARSSAPLAQKLDLHAPMRRSGKDSAFRRTGLDSRTARRVLRRTRRLAEARGPVAYLISHWLKEGGARCLVLDI